MPRHYKNAVVLADGKRVGYGLFQRGETWYVRFVDGNGKRVKKSLGDVPIPLRRGRWHLTPILHGPHHMGKIRKVAEDVIGWTFNIQGRIAKIQDVDAKRELTGKLRAAKSTSDLALLEKELRIHERLEQSVIFD